MISLRYSKPSLKFNKYLLYLSRKLKKNELAISKRLPPGALHSKYILFSLFPTLLTLKALTKDDKSAQTIILNADNLYADAQFEQLYALLESYKRIDNPEILWRVARAIFEKSRDVEKGTEKLSLLEEALELTNKALELNELCWAAHKWRALLLDYVWRYKSTKGRIIHSFEVKKHIMRAIELNPKDGTSYYILGEWCYTFADMPWYQRKAAAAIFASPPTSTYEEALHYFETAEKVEPMFYSMNLLMIGKCYLKLNNKEKAAEYLKMAAKYLTKTNEDQKAKDEAKKLLEHL